MNINACRKHRQTSTEGGECTGCAAEKRAAIGDPVPDKQRIQELEECLRFYSKGNHFEDLGANGYTPDGTDCPHYADADSVSGEPINWLEGHGDFRVEDGTYAKICLEQPQRWRDLMEKNRKDPDNGF